MTENSNRLPPTVYDSAIDWWIAAMLLLTPIVASVVGIALLFDSRPGDASILFLAGAIAIVFTALLTLPCRYRLLDDTLNVRCGVICYSIPYDTIENVECSSSWLSGPALSLRRIRLTSRGKHYLISPKNREAFIADLESRLPTPLGE